VALPQVRYNNKRSLPPRGRNGKKSTKRLCRTKKARQAHRGEQNGKGRKNGTCPFGRNQLGRGDSTWGDVLGKKQGGRKKMDTEGDSLRKESP